MLQMSIKPKDVYAATTIQGFMLTMVLKVTFTIQCCREGHVVKGTRYGITSRIWGHSLDTIFSLIWWKLLSEDLCCDEWLKTEFKFSYKSSGMYKICNF